MADKIDQNAEEHKKVIASRNMVLAWSLIGAVALLFVVTVAKIQGNIAG